ncbi:MAG: GLPGLI family protein [Muribaculaceae bacterium]|nr:GLPGLI family protein [Muribaculaceae bacterium]
MRCLIFSILSMALLAVCGMTAQIKIAYGLESPNFLLAPVPTDKSETQDTAYLTITYSYRYRASEKDDSLSNEDLLDLLIGKNYNAFYSRNLRELDIANTEEIKKTMLFKVPEPYYVGWDILRNNSNNEEIVTHRLPFSEQVIEYKDSMPNLIFAPLEETDSVMGYLCKTAMCDFGGRRWKVYYTEEIPLPYGPWKLNGAEGLILKALDTENNFIFEAAGLTQTPRPILRYQWNRKRMSVREWKEFEKEMYRNAGMFVRSTGARVLIMDNSERGHHRLKEDWSQYYNPLERD